MDGDWERNLEGLEMLVSLAKEHTEVGGVIVRFSSKNKWLVVFIFSHGKSMVCNSSQILSEVTGLTF